VTPSPAVAGDAARNARVRGCGIGLRAAHQEQIAAERPRIAWLEAHSENYFAEGGAQLELLASIRESYELSLHGVGLSLGSTDPLDRAHLALLARLVRRFEPALVSEHLSWGSVGGRFLNDLLPMPHTEEALRHFAARVRAVQDALGRQILIENVSSYLEFTASQMPEWEFLAALVQESGCGLLLDVNNVYVNARNHGFNARRFLDCLPRRAVQEMHLAGHSVRRIGSREILVDTHSTPVCNDVWQLYAHAVARFDDVPTLIEWDIDLPAIEVLQGEAAKAERIAGSTHARAA
jgi:uncharacterized protein (UPF0276 family)